jgi:cyanate permease
MAPLVTPIIRDLHLSYTQMGLILGSWQLTYILVAVIAGRIIDKWGVRKSLMAGTVTMALSEVLRFFPKGFEGMLGCLALFGAGGSMISVGVPKAVSLWFKGKRRGTALGICMAHSWVGAILTLALTNSLVMPLVAYSWRTTFLLYGLLTGAIALVWWFLSKEAGLSSSDEDAGIMQVFARLTGIRSVQIVLITGLLTFVVIHGFSQWLPKILEMKGLSPASASLAASVPYAAGIPSLLLIPSLIPPKRRGHYVAISSLFNLLALVLVTTSSGIAQFIGLILYGFITISIVPMLTLFLMDIPEVGSRYMGSAGGMFFCISEIGGFTGPSIMGFLVDATGTFYSSVFLLAAVCVAISILGLFMKVRAVEKNE